MSFVRYLLILLFVFLGNNAFSGTICVSSCDTGAIGAGQISAGPDGNIELINGGPIQLLSDIYVDGDMFLDYSIFSTTQDLTISQDFNIEGQNVNIFGFNNTNVFPEQYSTYVVNGGLIGDYVGTWVFFGSSPLGGGQLSASGNIYIGNYSSLSPVPLPASIWLLVSGLILFKNISSKVRKRS